MLLDERKCLLFVAYLADSQTEAAEERNKYVHSPRREHRAESNKVHELKRVSQRARAERISKLKFVFGPLIGCPLSLSVLVRGFRTKRAVLFVQGRYGRAQISRGNNQLLQVTIVQ
jgi:hypothetical protein